MGLVCPGGLEVGGPTAVVRMKVAVSSHELMGELQPCPRGAGSPREQQEEGRVVGAAG